ncbi:MAG: hypothetical protein AB8I80_14160, partial [Anaerolineae bacterium]
IQVYTDEETKRRIELAAVRQNIAVTEYRLRAIEQRLAEDDMLERATIWPQTLLTVFDRAGTIQADNRDLYA